MSTAEAARKIALPKMLAIPVPEVAGQNYKRSDYKAEVSPTLLRYDDGSFAGRKTQEQALQILGEHGLTLPPMALLYHLSLKGKDSPFFNDAFARNPEKKYYWEHTATKITPPKDKDNYPQDSDGRYVGVIWEYLPGKGFVPIAEQRIPQGNGNAIVAVEPATGIALETTPDMKTKHTTHWRFDPNLKENVVLFGSYLCVGGHGRCFGAGAGSGPQVAGDGGFRPVRGSFGAVEKIAKTYEDGLREGHEKGFTHGREEGIAIGRKEVADELVSDGSALTLRELLRKYKLE